MVKTGIGEFLDSLEMEFAVVCSIGGKIYKGDSKLLDVFTLVHTIIICFF